jgi:hypothetical protein
VRFLCAFVLGQAGFDDAVARRILVEHLADNHIGGDAIMAAHALYRLGPAALPTVRGAMAFADEQARSLLKIVELDLIDPPRDPEAMRQRAAMHGATRLYHDPAIEFDVGRSRIAHW